MKTFFLWATVLLAVGVSARPLLAADAGGTVQTPGLFSYQAPAGWKVTDSPISKNPVALGTPVNGFSPNINVVAQPYAGTLDTYVDLNCNQLKVTPIFQNLKILDRQPFATTSGLQGVRVTVTDTLGKLDMQQVFYFFAGTGDKKLVVTCSALIGDGPHYAPTFESSMKTFTSP